MRRFPPVMPEQLVFPGAFKGTSRPMASDARIIEEAVVELAGNLRETVRDLAFSEGEMAAFLRKAGLSPHDDGVEIGVKLNRVDGGFHLDGDVAEALDVWAALVSTIHAREVTSWVMGADLAPPAGLPARVIVEDGRGQTPGLGFRDPRYDATAHCCVLFDARRDRDVARGVITGHGIVPWEHVRVVGDPDPEDLALLRRTADRHAEADRRILGRRLTAEARRSYDLALSEGIKAARGAAPSSIPELARSLGEASESPGFDPLGPEALALDVALAVSRERRAQG